MKLLNNLDMNRNQTLNRVIQNLGTAPGTTVAGLEYYNTGTNTFEYWNGTAWKNPVARADHTGTQVASTISNLAAVVQAYTLNQFAVPTASVAFNGQKITGLGDPTLAQDAATMGWVQLQLQGFAPKGAADAATTAALPAAIYANGSSGLGATLTGVAVGILTVDSLPIGLNMIVLVKDQVAALENGLYKCTTAGTAGAAFVLTRATNMDVSAEYDGAYIVTEITSTVNAGAIFLCGTTAPTVGTTSITFTRINSVTSYTADNVTLLLTGNSFSIKTTYPGQASITTLGTITTGVWNGTAVTVAYGGTGAATPAGARTNLGATGKFAVTIGDNAATSIAVTHNLSTLDCTVSVVEVATGAVVFADVVLTNTNVATVSFSVAPTTGQYRVTVIG